MAENTDKKIYVGIDLDTDAAMVSYSYGNGEPETVSPMAGSEIFSIPLAVALKKDGSWAYGEEARRVGKAGLGRCEDHHSVENRYSWIHICLHCRSCWRVS